MKYGRLADFFFVGLGVIPAALMFGGLPDLAILLFVPLMFVACFFGMAEQKLERPEPSASSGTADVGNAQETTPRDLPGLTYREREPRD